MEECPIVDKTSTFWDSFNANVWFAIGLIVLSYLIWGKVKW